MEIVELFHAYGYLWAVGNALYEAGSRPAAAGVELLKDQAQLDTQGPTPVLEILARLRPTTEEAMSAIAAAQTYCTWYAARKDYPRFGARHLPLGSGAVESACKGLVEAQRPLLLPRSA